MKRQYHLLIVVTDHGSGEYRFAINTEQLADFVGQLRGIADAIEGCEGEPLKLGKESLRREPRKRAAS